jgi:hypothetical protein
VFERAIADEHAQQCVAIWRFLFRFFFFFFFFFFFASCQSKRKLNDFFVCDRYEAWRGAYLAASRLLYRALHHCAWSQLLYHDAVSALAMHLKAADRDELVALLSARRVRVHQPPPRPLSQ